MAEATIVTWGCELAHLGGCGGGLEQAHIVNKSRLRNVKGALKYVEKHKEVLLGTVCHNHNTTRAHDERRYRAYLLQKRVDLFGAEHVSGVLDGLRALFKDGAMDLRLEALLSHGEDKTAL